MRDQILNEIRRLASANGGKAPGRRSFEQETGIRESQWYRVYWSKWSDAILEAGLDANIKNKKLDTEPVLQRLAEAFRYFGKIPADSELEMYRRSGNPLPSNGAVYSQFRTKANMLVQLKLWTDQHQDFTDVSALFAQLPTEAKFVHTDANHFGHRRTEGLVYLIRSGAHYKIGRSDEIERRIKEIKVALPEAATLVHTIRTDDPPGIEAYWHRRFADRRANGEWFKLTASDLAAFKRRKFQ